MCSYEISTMVPSVYTVSPHGLPPVIAAPLSLPFNTENRTKAEGTVEEGISTRISGIGAAQFRPYQHEYLAASGLDASVLI